MGLKLNDLAWGFKADFPDGGLSLLAAGGPCGDVAVAAAGAAELGNEDWEADAGLLSEDVPKCAPADEVLAPA